MSPSYRTRAVHFARTSFVIVLLAGFAACTSEPTPNEAQQEEDSFWSLPRFGLPRVHKIVVQQGNVITQEMVDRLKPGMSKAQVEYVLGRPVLDDLFNPNRWTYIYSAEVPGYDPEKKTVVLEFNQDVLARLSGDFKPGAGAVAGDITTPPATLTPPEAEAIPGALPGEPEPLPGRGGDPDSDDGP